MYRYLLLLVLSCTAHAQCDNFYLGEAKPVIEEKGVEICYDEFAVHYSAEYNAPVYAVQALTAEQIRGSEVIKRDDAFHAEPSIKGIKPSVYRNTGYDKGHLAPAGDMGTTTSQYQSFSMANMVPQTPQNNREVWRHIESTVHDMAEKLAPSEKLYVVTGAVFGNDTIKDVRVPMYLYKAIYSPSTNEVGVFIAMNDATKTCSVMSLSAFTEMSGIIPFPNIPQEMLQKINANSTK